MTRNYVLTWCVVSRAKRALSLLQHTRTASASASAAAAAATVVHTMTPAPADTPTPTPTATATPMPMAAPLAHLLPENFHWLYRHCPVFPISGAKVRVIVDPREFYQELLDKAGTASRKISISSLYLGTGKLEERLVAAVDERAAAMSGLKVQWLLDHTRGSRGDHNSRAMLRPLLAQHPHCSVSLYHTPQLRGLLRRLIPQRWNETIGLQHMKLYVFDDSLVISGANLSNDYFTNRQDRYLVFDDCPALAAFYHSLIGTVSRHCLQLASDDTTAMPPATPVHPYQGDLKKYCSAMREAVQQLWSAECDKTQERLKLMETTTSSGPSASPVAPPDTLVFPTLQMGQFGITNDGYVTKRLLSSAEEGSRIHLASGYFNLTEEYMRCVLGQSRALYSILMAHPEANGFLGAGGFAGAIPAAYTHLAKLFFGRVQQGGQGQRVGLQEYRRGGWTFHAKGLWYARPGQSCPSLTMVGSPNFGWRSVQRDLETQVVVVTQREALREALHREHRRLYAQGTDVTQDTFTAPGRSVPFWVRCVMPIIKAFF